MMNQNPDLEISRETNRLLSKLDQAIDHSSAICAIVKRREQLYDLEGLTGPSPKTRTLRKEIGLMEQQLRADREALEADSDMPFLPA
jgi:hypothetical protein